MGKLARIIIILLIFIGIIGVVSSTDEDENINNNGRVSIKSTGSVKGASEAQVNEEGIRRIFSKPDDRIKVNLSNQGLSAFPVDILHNRTIQVLDLSNNEISKIPKQLRLLGNLQELYLNDNDITDLPNEIGEIKKLKRIYLKNNPIEKETKNRLKETFPDISFSF